MSKAKLARGASLERDGDVSDQSSTNISAAPSKTHFVSSNREIATPLGLLKDVIQPGSPQHAQQESKVNREEVMFTTAMSIAKSPGGKLFMTAFMLYMTGNSLQIFSIFMLAMSFWQPLKAIFDTKKVFERFEGNNFSLIQPYATWVLLNLVALGMALYKAQSMGLLPSFSELMRPNPIVKQGVEFSSPYVPIVIDGTTTAFVGRT